MRELGKMIKDNKDTKRIWYCQHITISLSIY